MLAEKRKLGKVEKTVAEVVAGTVVQIGFILERWSARFLLGYTTIGAREYVIRGTVQTV